MSNRLKKAIIAANRMTLIAGSLSALTMASIGAVAQENTNDLSGLEEEVLVLGIRGSLQQSLDTKRNASSIVDAVTSEDIGKFPDKNVAESLSRVTGVSITRDFGEGEKISVRGTDPSQNRTLLNGSAVASADWFVLDNPSRAFNYTLLPSNVVSSLEVYKSPQADVQEGSLGGTVYLRTRKPLDLDPNTISIQAQGQYSDKSEEWDPQLSAMYSYKTPNDVFGVLVSFTKQDRTLTRDGIEALGFTTEEINGKDYWRPRSVGNAYFYQERERETGLLSLQLRPNDKLDMTLNYLNSELKADNINHNLVVWLTRNGALDHDTAVYEGDSVVAGTMLPCSDANLSDEGSNSCNLVSEMAVINRESGTETEALDFDLTYESDSYRINAKLGTTEASGGTSKDNYLQYNQNLSRVDFDGRGETFQATMIMPDGRAQTNQDILNRNLEWMQKTDRLMTDEETYFGSDIEFDVEFGAINSLKMGFNHRDHDKGQTQNDYRFHWWTDDQHAAGGSYFTDVLPGEERWMYGAVGAEQAGGGFINTYSYLHNGNYTPGNFLDGVTGTNTIDNYPLLEGDRMDSVMFSNSVMNDYGVRPYKRLSGNWDVNEKINAFFLKAEFEGEGFRGDMGLRYVKTDVASTGWVHEGDPLAATLALQGEYDLLVDFAFPTDPNAERVTAHQVTTDHTYTSILPNVNVSFDLTDDTIFRLSASRTMSRPDYITIASQESFNVNTLGGAKGNPKLNPTYSNNFDISYEWYFTDTSALTATYFYKDITGAPTNGTISEQRYDTETSEYVMIDFNAPVNGKGYVTEGLEIGYQQSFGDFGVLANATISDVDHNEERDAAADSGVGLVIGHSNFMYNLTGYYENSFVSTRLSYNYRSEYYDGISSFNSEVFTDDFGQLDASVSVNLGEHVELVFEAVNLLDEEVNKYHQSEERFSKVYKNGSRFVIGANVKF
ncbi:TonB-dependent receptor [Teredinibacter sp. KSP-S5-2]|uniref:TonB-dependent receptor n=1 Tax=Teredinibacter sp. KSP-S5-2 TaxID=3034506 RepID=UPI002934A134|nr:TonB-dependent receptor [Teredinibacter sp. KSP-S5-2]WNO09779.1 TonB-dependent receptor [Teredinibacter sp. KSP-S5-2]